MAYPAQSDISAAGSRAGRGSEGGGHNRTMMLPTGETDDVEVARETEVVMKPESKPWAHFLAGGYVLGEIYIEDRDEE